MPRNITVNVSDELAKRMDKFPEVNWSAVTRECIDQYLLKREQNERKEKK